MKTIITLFLLLVIHFSFAQQKEWSKVIDLLSKEASYFSDKSGYFRLAGNAVTNFKYQKMIMNDSVFISEMHHTHRFNPESDKEAFVTTKVDLPWCPSVKSAEIIYDHTAYFDAFPEVLFLKIEFGEATQHTTTAKLKHNNTETKNEELNEVFIMPIRTKNREKILKAIDSYQTTEFKRDLENDTYH